MNHTKLILALFVVFVFLFGCTGPQPSDKQGEWGANPENKTQDSEHGTVKPPPPNQSDQYHTPPPDQNGQPPKEEFQLPYIDLSKPLQGPPVIGEKKTISLGNLDISYYSVAASHQTFSLGADVLIHVKNAGTKTETLYMHEAKEIAEGHVPNWCMHFFSFNNPTVTIGSGEEKILHFFASNDAEGEFTVPFEFWQKSDRSDMVTANIKFHSGGNNEGKLSQSAIVYGYVRDKVTNKTIDDAEIRITYFSMREGITMQSDGVGNYAAPVAGMEDINAYFGDQEVAYSSLAYSISAEKDGYEYYYQGEVAPKRGEKLRMDIYLEPKKQDAEYSMKWESKVSEPYGFFWVLSDENMKYLVASQAKHSPELNKPTHFYLFNPENGQKLWSYATENECWGIDISEDGSMVATGCHDGHTYVVNTADGSLEWEFDNGAMNREVEFSHNGKYLLTGPAENNGVRYQFALFNAANGEFLKGFSTYDEWLRNSRFTEDDSKFVAGMSNGIILMYSVQSGNKLWENRIGEFPLFFAVDNEDNTYACGKGRTLFSYDVNGNVRWSYRVPDHTVTAGAITPDGSRIVVGTVGGWVHYLDGKTGKVLWRAKIKGENVAHNAVSISNDGKIVAIGSGPENHLTIFDETGTKIFEHESELNSDPILNDKWATIGTTSSAGSQKGIMCTYTSADGNTIVAAYGDDYIREFVR